MTAISNRQNEASELTNASRQRLTADRQKMQPLSEMLFDQFSNILDEITQSLIASEEYRDYQATLNRQSDSEQQPGREAGRPEVFSTVRAEEQSSQGVSAETARDAKCEPSEPEVQEQQQNGQDAAQQNDVQTEETAAQPLQAELVSQVAAGQVAQTPPSEEKPVLLSEDFVMSEQMATEQEAVASAEQPVVQVEEAVVQGTAVSEVLESTEVSPANENKETQAASEDAPVEFNPEQVVDAEQSVAAPELELPVSGAEKISLESSEVKGQALNAAVKPVQAEVQTAVEPQPIQAEVAQLIQERLNQQPELQIQNQAREVFRAQTLSTFNAVEASPAVALAAISASALESASVGSQIQQSALRLIQESGAIRQSDAAQAQIRAQQVVQSVSASLNSQNSENSGFENLGKALKTLSRPDAQRTLEKVQNALKEVSRSHDGKTISLRLDPPSLGNVKIDISYREGMLHARIVAESPAVNNMLREKASELQSLLRKVGLEAEQVSVSVGSDNGNAGGFHESYFEARERRTAQQGMSRMASTTAQSWQSNSRSATAVKDDHWVA